MKPSRLLTNCSLLALTCTAFVQFNLTTAHAAYPDVVLANNPVAYYRLEETSGATAFDATLNHFDAAYAPDTDTNGVTSGPMMGLPGINTNSLLFRYYRDDLAVAHRGFVNIPYKP